MATSTPAQQFYVIRTATFNAKGATDLQRRVKVESEAWPRYTSSDLIRFRTGSEYLFVPRCGSAFGWNKEIRRTMPPQQPLLVGC